jgi:hypothetical protein
VPESEPAALIFSRRLAAPPDPGSGIPFLRLALSADERTRLRGQRRSLCGQELLLQLERGAPLQPGEWLSGARGGPAVQVGVLRELSTAAGVVGMVGGQYLDIEDAGGTSAEALARVHALKTGRLMACAVHVALVLAPPPPAQEHAYRAFARELGLLFQIVDDILDVAGSEEALGKAVGTDERLGKVTYVSLHGMDRARELAAESHARAIALLGQVDGPVDDLAGIADTAFARQS